MKITSTANRGWRICFSAHCAFKFARAAIWMVYARGGRVYGAIPKNANWYGNNPTFCDFKNPLTAPVTQTPALMGEMYKILHASLMADFDGVNICV